MKKLSLNILWLNSEPQTVSSSDPIIFNQMEQKHSLKIWVERRTLIEKILTDVLKINDLQCFLNTMNSSSTRNFIDQCYIFKNYQRIVNEASMKYQCCIDEHIKDINYQ